MQLRYDEARALRNALSTKRGTANAKATSTRKAKGDWKAEKQRVEEEYMAAAAEKRARAFAGRETTRRAKAELLELRNSAVKGVRCAP